MNGETGQSAQPRPRSVLARGLSILDTFTSEEPELTLAEIAARSGLPKPTAHRLLGDLVEWGAIERSGPGHYRLATKLFRLGQLVPLHRVLREAALPHLEHLHAVSRENVHLAVPDSFYSLFVERVTGRDAVPLRTRVGSRLLSHCTATGKVFLAWGGRERLRQLVNAGLPRFTPRTIVLPGLLHQDLARALERGVATTYEEAEAGVAAVAAPVHGRDGQVVAALSVTGRAQTMDFDRFGHAVKTAASALSNALSDGV
ncbi:IclR family transcriptional regulator [Saccharomonospora viridis]|uniref:Glycerol operon regulatory protein n=1 Tax=Saccharomonospora viridis (strain ATCC 15386 / DSM 43017 / JCM 3036 / CCUG 5913 / NBRC 12207 / NCIMB 9602 / P101) TaxID=471857 RepID=C7MR10_SACVD|nr:IclR family transcriptional regulator [Saccharomonospora viridis]ACU96556.1 transcriptional regulator [Saccharomonospora viridis DSM 43017]